MKHVFLMHSHTLYMTARGVINKLQLPYKDIVFILGINYKCYDLPDGIQTFDFTNFKNSLGGNIWDEIKRRNIQRIRKVDNLIEEIIGEEFTLYAPHLLNPYFKIIATNKLCVDLKFVQEGIVDFCSGDDKNKKKILKTLFSRTFLVSRGRLWVNPKFEWDYYAPGVLKASETFAIFDKLFSRINCKHTVVQWPKFKLRIELEENSMYFISDALVEYSNIERDIYMRATEKMIKKYAKKDACNYIKFHPYQKENNIRHIIYLFFKNGYKVKVLPNDVPFETILASKEHMEVCGFTSSITLFSALMPQHETHVCIPALYSSTKFVVGFWKGLESNLTRCFGDKFKYDDLSDVNISQASVDATKIELPHGFSYARIDIKNEGFNDNDVDVFEISDAAANVTAPKWMRHNGSGRMITSEKGTLALKFRCVGNGKVIITLRGEDIRENGKKVHAWVDYTKFVVDNEVMFNEVRPIWHDKFYRFTTEAEDGRVITLHIKWRTANLTVRRKNEHSSKIQKNAIEGPKVGTELEQRLKDANTANKKLQMQLKEANAENKKLERQLADMRSGMSFRIGRAITYIPRKIFGKK